jgi:hypothetical protein
MKYTVEMGSGVMIYLPNFMKIGPGIQNLTGGRYIDKRTAIGSPKSAFIFSNYGTYAKNKLTSH